MERGCGCFRSVLWVPVSGGGDADGELTVPDSKVVGVGKTDPMDERSSGPALISDSGDAGVNTSTLNATLVGFGAQSVLHVVTAVVILMSTVGGWND